MKKNSKMRERNSGGKRKIRECKRKLRWQGGWWWQWNWGIYEEDIPYWEDIERHRKSQQEDRRYKEWKKARKRRNQEGRGSKWKERKRAGRDNTSWLEEEGKGRDHQSQETKRVGRGNSSRDESEGEFQVRLFSWTCDLTIVEKWSAC